MSPHRPGRQTAESKYFNLFTLRRLFNQGNIGRGTQGVRDTRQNVHVTLTNLTVTALRQVVPYGKGQYGSPLIDIALRVIFVLVGALRVEPVAEAMAMSMKDRLQVVQRLRELATAIEEYTPTDSE